MELYQFLLEIGKQHGPAGLIIGFLVWDKLIVPRRRKRNGDWVSWQSLDARLKDLNETHKNHEVEDNARFTKIESIEGNVEKMLMILEDRIHSYASTVRGDLKSFREELRQDAETIKEDLNRNTDGLNARIDKLWELLAKK